MHRPTHLVLVSELRAACARTVSRCAATARVERDGSAVRRPAIREVEARDIAMLLLKRQERLATRALLQPGC